MFHFVAEAYEVLTDDEKRKNYNIFGTPATTTGGQSKGPQRPYYHQNYNAEELYSKIFKEAGKRLDYSSILISFVWYHVSCPMSFPLTTLHPMMFPLQHIGWEKNLVLLGLV